MTFVYRMHGVPVPGDINQMQESARPMICLANQVVHHHISDCQNAAYAHSHEDNLAGSWTIAAAVSPKAA
jgi:hypothetical protein